MRQVHVPPMPEHAPDLWQDCRAASPSYSRTSKVSELLFPSCGTVGVVCPSSSIGTPRLSGNQRCANFVAALITWLRPVMSKN
jgi:hypothetical protein